MVLELFPINLLRLLSLPYSYFLPSYNPKIKWAMQNSRPLHVSESLQKQQKYALCLCQQAWDWKDKCCHNLHHWNLVVGLVNTSSGYLNWSLEKSTVSQVVTHSLLVISSHSWILCIHVYKSAEILFVL